MNKPNHSQLVQFHPTIAQWNEMFNALFSLVGLKVLVEKDSDHEEYKKEGDSIAIKVYRDGVIIFGLNANLDVFQPECGVSILHPKGSKAPYYQEGYRLWTTTTTGGSYWHPPEQEDVTIAQHHHPAAIVKGAFDLVIEHATEHWTCSSQTLGEQEEKDRKIEEKLEEEYRLGLG